MTRLQEGVSDLLAGLRAFEFWTFIAHHEIRQRYRRSYIGPFWVTITTGALVAAIGTLYGGLLGAEAKSYVPHLAISIVTWGFCSQTVLDGCQMFLEAGGAMRQMQTARSTFLFKIVYRNILLLAHNAIVVVAVLLFFAVPVGVHILALPLTLALVVLNAAWMALIAGILCTRFRDVAPIVATLIQLLFFATPVMWQPSQLPPHLNFIKLNPFYHLLEIVREPLLGNWPATSSLLVAGGLAVVGWGVALVSLGTSRRRIVFWV